MDQSILDEVLSRLKSEFRFKDNGTWLQEGKCPHCNERELFTRKENPWILRCGRSNRCGKEVDVRKHYQEIFDSWSTRFKPTREAPNASADAYLINKRGLKLAGMVGCYSQETYRDYDRNIYSATVRFPLPGGGHWERLIDQDWRFEKKAHFKKDSKWSGWWWQCPDQPMEVLARASRLWMVEGIFDAWSWRDAGECAVSCMSVNVYPEKSLKELRRVCAELGVPGPTLIWAFDPGKAGAEYTVKFVAKSIKDGFRAVAAQPLPEGETAKVDWNDLGMRNQLKGYDRVNADGSPFPGAKLWIDHYLWNGEVLLAETATEKAMLLWQKNHWSSFHFTYDSRTFWAYFNEAKIAETMKEDGCSELLAARSCVTVNEIANCAFKILYFQKDKATGDKHYYLDVDLSGNDGVHREKFTPASLTAAGDFKKLLMGSAPGAQWTGSTFQLDRIVNHQRHGLKTVETIDFTGYSKDHDAWILGGMAVQNGRYIPINDEDYFDLGKAQVKLRSSERLLEIDYDPDGFDTSWLPHLFTAWRGNGLATLAFWGMSFFATQIRRAHQSLGYLEMSGKANTGKTTIIMFLWKCVGMADEAYEGIDPTKSTLAGYIRTLSSVANLPVVFMEGDRNQENPHSKKFDWSEIKGLFNGTIGRATGKKSQGNETNNPPFRAALVIEQNHPVDSDEPILSRIMQTKWTKEGWSPETKIAAETIADWPREKVSGTIVHLVKREAEYMKVFLAAYPRWERHLTEKKITHARVRKCHGQLHAGLDALAAVMKIPPHMVKEGHDHIDVMARERLNSLFSDHPIVADFWHKVDFIESREVPEFDQETGNATVTKPPVNLARNPTQSIAINLVQFEAACRAHNINCPPMDELKRHLPNSQSRPFIAAKTVNTITGRHTHCWVFQTPEAAAAAKKGA